MEIEEKEHFSESLELLQTRINVTLQNLYVMQEELLGVHSKFNVEKLTRALQIFYQVLRQELISY